MNRRFFNNNINVVEGVRCYQQRKMYAVDDSFEESGITVFCGRQGSGKTYSAVRYVFSLMQHYSKCLLVTNVDLGGIFCPFMDRIYPYLGLDSFSGYNNGIYGVIFLIDELHIEFLSLESKNMPVTLFTEISQQRKQRKHIVGTAQVFERMAKPFREQCNDIIFCNNYLKLMQRNVIMDGFTIGESLSGQNEHVGEVKRVYFFFHNRALDSSFDTDQKIVRQKKGVKK